MREIIPTRLWIGQAADLIRLADLDQAGVNAVVHLADEGELPDLDRESLCFHIPLLDGAGNDPVLVGTAIDATILMIRAGVPVLVCCAEGLSRAPSITAAAMALVDARAPETVLGEIANGTRRSVSRELWADVVGVVQSRRRG